MRNAAINIDQITVATSHVQHQIFFTLEMFGGVYEQNRVGGIQTTFNISDTMYYCLFKYKTCVTI